MKTNGSLIGGRLIDDPRIYRAYAPLLREVRAGLPQRPGPVDAVTLQNEPQNRHPRGTPAPTCPAAQEEKLRGAVGAAFDAAGLNTKILGYDHNWSEHPDDIASTPPGEDPETDYPYRLLRSAAGALVRRHRLPLLRRRRGRQTELHDTFPTQSSGSPSAPARTAPSDPPAQVFSDTLKWHTRNLVLGVTRNWASTIVNWNLALDPSGGPHNGGCDTCTGVVTVGPGQTVTRNAEYYTLGHLARFVRPGAHRIASTSFGTTGWNGAVMDTAFRNPDGTIVLVAHNENDDPRRSPSRRAAVVRLHAARRRARHLRLAVLGGAGRRPPAARPARHDRRRVRGRRPRQGRRRRRSHPLDHGRRPAARADPHGRPARDPHRRPAWPSTPARSPRPP